LGVVIIVIIIMIIIIIIKIRYFDLPLSEMSKKKKKIGGE